MLVVLLAPPGTGKGTQVKFLREYGFSALSGSGVLSEARKDPALMQVAGEIENLQARGELVNDRLMNDLMVHFSVKIQPETPLVLDGFPRTSGQVRGLEQICSRRLFSPNLSHKDFFALLFEGVGSEQAWQWVKEGHEDGTRPVRPDDSTLEKFRYRHDLYQKELPGILSRLPTSRVFTVDATRTKEGVHRQICNTLGLAGGVNGRQYPDHPQDDVVPAGVLVPVQPEEGCGC